MSLQYGGCAGKSITYDKCFIESANFNSTFSHSSATVGSTILVKNSKIKKGSYLYNITAQNSNISFEEYLPMTSISCILRYTGNYQPLFYKSSGCHTINSLCNFDYLSNDYFHDCYYVTENSNDGTILFGDDMNCLIDLEKAGYLGEDGTIVGIYGGEYPFSENPSMPTVDIANSSVVYDAENNKLKVSITVKAD